MRTTLNNSVATRNPLTPTAALQLLVEANSLALQHCRDLWQWALEIDALRKAGLTNNHLRWLRWQGHVAVAVETTEFNAPDRTFQPMSNLHLPPRAAVVLTGPGLAYAVATLDANQNRRPMHVSADKPHWDSETRQLTLGGVVVKKFKQPAVVQELILQVFHEDNWPPRIADPLSGVPGLNAKLRLHAAINNLNRARKNPLVEFHGGGDGESICWRLCEPLAGGEAHAIPERN